MLEELSLQRAELRHRLLKGRGQLDAQQRVVMETALLQRLLALPVIQKAEVFLVYCAYRSEVATSGLIDQFLDLGKTVCVPLCAPVSMTMAAVRITDPGLDLFPGYKGIPEPDPKLARARSMPAKQLEVVIVPGAVFDRRGYRLGYGGGYYDRFLALEAPQALRIGLAFDLQLVDQLPEEPHDVPMDWLVTEGESLSWPRPDAAAPQEH